MTVEGFDEIHVCRGATCGQCAICIQDGLRAKLAEVRTLAALWQAEAAECDAYGVPYSRAGSLRDLLAVIDGPGRGR